MTFSARSALSRSLCNIMPLIAGAVARVMKFFVYSITTTLPHLELHVKELYV